MKKQLKKIVSLVAIVVTAVVCFAFSSEAAINWGRAVYISQYGQVVDSITHKGVTVNAVYAPRNQVANYDSDGTFCCAAFVKRFYSSVYGVGVYNLFPGDTPLVSSGGGYFYKVSTPQVGDIAGNSGHWAIVKAVSGNTVTLVEQNTWNLEYNSAQVGRTLVLPESSYWFFRWSGNSGGGSSVAPSYFTALWHGEVGNNNARIDATINLTYIQSCGFYLGTSTNNMKRIDEPTNANVKNIWFNLKDYYGPLNPGTTYYYKIYIVVNGVEYATNVQSFTTTGHSHSYSVKTIPASCKLTGLKTYTCSCGYRYTETLAKKPHTLTTLKAVASTCTKEGKTEGKRCTVCGTVTVAQKTVAQKAHTNKNVTTKATLSKNGKIESKCSVCGYVSKITTVYYPKTIKLSKATYTYDGKEKKPSVTVKDSKGNTLKNGTDYTVSYEGGRKNTGRYSVTVTFKGKYSGTKKLTYTIAPKATGKLTASQSTSTVTLKWDKVTGATGYAVYQYKSGEWKKIKDLPSGKTLSYKVQKLKAGITYKFRIKAYKKDDGTIWGGAKDISTTTKPSTPKITKLTSSKGKANVTWSNVGGENGYEVNFSSEKNSGYRKLGNFKADVTKGSRAELTKGNTYFFRVRAFKTVGNTKIYSAWSSIKSIKIK